MQPRLIQARVAAGETGPQSLTWILPADFKEDKYEEWVNVEGKDQVERSIFPAEQARGQLHWLEAMHAAGLYKNELAYPHLQPDGIRIRAAAGPESPKSIRLAPREYASPEDRSARGTRVR